MEEIEEIENPQAEVAQEPAAEVAEQPTVMAQALKVAANRESEKPAVSKAAASKEALAEDAPEEPILKELGEDQAKLPWYAVHAYSGFEERAKTALEERIRQNGLELKFGNIIIPQETVVELIRGKKKTSKRKFFPGYMIIQMQLNDDTWHLVSDTPKITGFVGGTRNPTPLLQSEVDTMINQMQGGAGAVRSKVRYEYGDQIKVVDGPFADFNGTVEEVKPEKGKLRVLISIFGRNTPVELDFVQVEKV